MCICLYMVKNCKILTLQEKKTTTFCMFNINNNVQRTLNNKMSLQHMTNSSPPFCGSSNI